MTYVNLIPRMRRGFSRCRRVEPRRHHADLPIDEAGLGRLLPLGSGWCRLPTTTDARLEVIAAWRPPFVYGIAEMGVTGERARSSDRAGTLVTRIRRWTDVPIALGVGISSAAAASRAAAIADGVIVGSALVRRVLEAPDARSAAASLSEAVGELAGAMRH
jgi:tryptophan synthase alpha chain